MTGSYLLAKLIKADNNVFALKRENSSLSITKNIFDFLLKDNKTLFSRIHWIDGDITDFNSVNKAMQGIDYVYHTAAMVSFKPSDKKEMLHTNIQGTVNVVNAALNNNIKKLCHISSIAALGNTINNKIITEDTEREKKQEVSDYSISKYRSENEVWRGIAEGLNAIIVNPSVILGISNWNKGSAQFIKTINDGLKYYTKGGTGFIDAEDVANIMIKLTESNTTNKRFILNSENLSYKRLFDIIAKNLNKKAPYIETSNFMLNSLRYFDKIRYVITNKEPRVTKFTVKSAQQTKTYSNTRIKEVLNYNFKPIETLLNTICERFILEINQNN